MSRKIVKPNGRVLYNTSSRRLNPDEEKDPMMVRRTKTYDIAIKKKLVRGMSEEDLMKYTDFVDYVTLTYEPYEDDDDDCPPLGMHNIDSSDDDDSDSDYEEDDYDDVAGVDTYDKYVGGRV
jgi:hypothetical protein